MLEEWFLRIIQLVIFFLATSLLYEDYRSNKRPQKLCLVISFFVIMLKEMIALLVVSGQTFFTLPGAHFWFPVVNDSLGNLFYMFMSYSLYLGYWKRSAASVKKTLIVTVLSLAVLGALIYYYWHPFAYNQRPYFTFWGNTFFKLLQLGLVGAIIGYLGIQKQGLFKGWMQGGFYILLLAHILHFTILIRFQGQGIGIATERLESIVLFLGYLTLALSQIKPKIQPKLILLLISILLLPGILTIIMISTELKNRLLVFTYEKVSQEGVLNTIFELKKTLYLIAGLGVVLASFIGYIFSTRIINPLARLVQGAKEVGKGELSSRIDVKTKDELGELADEFNQMTASLQEKTSKLEQTNKKLVLVNQELVEKGRELVQASKMASIGQLAGGVAHEINNPLASMLGWAQLGQEMIEKKKAKAEEKECLNTIKRYLQTIVHGVRRCRVVTESLLKISRQMDLSETVLVDINQVIEDTFVLIQYQTRFRNIEIKKIFASDLPKLKVNLGQLQQVFSDLISNAALAMPKGGKLSIITSNKDGKFAEVKIIDTGCGIPGEHLDKVFDPFFTTRKTGQGMGLGLSVAYGIIKQHGGIIEVESKEGFGSTFTVRLPVA